MTKLKKMKRQENAPTMMPASVGPTAEANMMTSAVTPMAAPSLKGGMTSMTMANIIGRTRPVPMPWMARPIRATSKLFEKPLMSAPTRKAPSANTVSLRAENHFISRLANGSTMPMASM